MPASDWLASHWPAERHKQDVRNAPSPACRIMSVTLGGLRDLGKCGAKPLSKSACTTTCHCSIHCQDKSGVESLSNARPPERGVRCLPSYSGWPRALSRIASRRSALEGRKHPLETGQLKDRRPAILILSLTS